MATIRDRILDYLQRHPEGVDDDELTSALGLKRRQQANSRCRQLAAEGIVVRRSSQGKLHNFLAHPSVIGQPQPASGAGPTATMSRQESLDVRPWFWEGNVQNAVIAHLQDNDYRIVRSANTATRETGKDIEAQGPHGPLWVTVKGFPVGTPKTQPSTQAGHWFKQAVFDIVAWHGESSEAALALALPDFPRYRRLAEKIAWLQLAAHFAYYWVQENGAIEIV